MNIRNLAVCALCAVMMLLSACGGESRLLETVPADAPGVVTINTHRLMSSLDGIKYGGRLTADETLDRFLVHASARTRVQLKALIASDVVADGKIAGFSTGNGLSSVMSMIKGGGYVYTFNISDKAKLLSQLGAGAGDAEGEFETYALDDATLYVLENQVWVMAGDRAKCAEVLSEQLQRAENKSMMSVKGVGRFLDDNDDIMRVAVSTDLAGDKGWTCVAVNTADDGLSIDIDGHYMDIDGKEAQLDKYLEDIDLKLMDYTMPSDVFVMAVGIRNSTDWDGLMQYIQTIRPLDYKQRAIAAMIVPYLKRIDGTFMVAVGPTLDRPVDKADFSNDINFVVALQMKKSEVKKTMGDFGDLLSMLGVPMVKRGDDYVIQSPGMAPVMLKTVDGNCIVLTNRPLEQLGNDEAKKTMKGNGLAIWANIPNSLGETVYGGRGFRLTAELDGDFESNFRFNGPAGPILEQLAMLVSPDDEVTGGDDAADASDMGFAPIDTVR